MGKTKVRISEDEQGRFEHAAGIYDVKIVEISRYAEGKLVVQVSFKSPDALFEMGKNLSSLAISVPPQTPISVGGGSEIQGIKEVAAGAIQRPVSKVKHKSKR